MARDRDLQRRYGPWAVVTGASEGIGRQMAVHLAREGLNVVLVARRADLLAGLAGEIGPRGVETKVITADLSLPAGVAEVVARTSSLDAGLLVAAAGFGTA